MLTTATGRDPGSALTLVLVGLAIVGLVALAGHEASRFGLNAARSQASAVAAQHAAESVIDAFVAGAGPDDGPLDVLAHPGRATLVVRRLVTLGDSAVVVSVTAEAEAPAGTARPVRRRFGAMVRIDSSGNRQRVRGSWREEI